MESDQQLPEKIEVRQIRGTVCRTQKVRRTLAALGLGRIGKSKVLPANPAVVGMIRSVRHLVEVKPAKE
ncbi:MAG: 50S ribosomal protein L30 [Bdellovibrionales bacterium]|nr:50S ribosomal protein L30 [Bdellovibrionales bacterium]